MEYWYLSTMGAWIVADPATGDLLLDDNGNVLEFGTEGTVLFAFPDAFLSLHMGD